MRKQKSEEIYSVNDSINTNFSSLQLLKIVTAHVKPIQNLKDDEDKSNPKKDKINFKEEVIDKYSILIFNL
jgi:hypothetical protein